MRERIKRLQEFLVQEKLDGLVITSLTNIRYLCGFTGSNAALLVTLERAIFYTDFRYKEQMKGEVKGCQKKVLERDLYASFPVEDLKGVRRLGVEESHISLSRFRLLRSQLKGVKLIPTRDLVMELRRRKSPVELALIKKAQRITENTFAKVLNLISPGVREKDLALEIEFQFRKVGEPAFPPIVASGENGAKPHARAGFRRIKKGDRITFDIGCRLEGYAADMTRTVFLGKPDEEWRKVYEAVLLAQERAIETIKPGVLCKEVDRVARDILEQVGLAKFFGHSLGHGVGLDVHEQPTLAKNSSQMLAQGDVVTVEPGVYLPGKGGVRIEDMVVVTEDGYLNLTKAPKRLLVL
ncbi:MAG: Xaa-Pro peptidase family protein [candidate division WOR-3 bacterium]